MKNVVLIYNDEGAGQCSLIHLKNMMDNLDKEKYDIKFANAEYILKSNWQINCKIICFGGGYDKGYLNKLNNKGCQLIKEFVYNGGIYIGICAGAYFACDYIEFDKNGPLEIVGERFIKLFNGVSYGPIFPGFDYDSRKGVHAVEIFSDCKMNVDKLYAFYEGGCAFRNCADFNETSILYKYSVNNEAAIIHSKFGKGQALLSGVHFEYNPDDINFEIKDEIKQKLNEAQYSRKLLITDLFKYLKVE